MSFGDSGVGVTERGIMIDYLEGQNRIYWARDRRWVVPLKYLLFDNSNSLNPLVFRRVDGVDEVVHFSAADVLMMIDRGDYSELEDRDEEPESPF